MAKVVGYALQLYGAFTGNAGFYYAGVALVVGDSIEQEKRQKRRNRALFNDAQKDRLEMVDRDSNQARTLAMGRVRAVEGVRIPKQSGVHLENLALPVSLAGHEIDGVEQYFLHDTPVTLDAQGWVQQAPWSTGYEDQKTATGVLDAAGGAVINLEGSPSAAGAIAVWSTGSGDSLSQGPANVSLAGAVATISGGQPFADVSIVYALPGTKKRVRIRSYLGTPTQSIGGDLSAEYPGKLRPTDHYRGIPIQWMDCIYDPDVFPQGRPTLTALFRGAKLYDPRKDSTVPGGSGSHRWANPSTWEWSRNPALQVLRYATWEFGMAIPVQDVSMADVIEAANACDVQTTFTLRKTDNTTSTVTMPRYTCDIVISSEADRRASMDSIVETMAGRWTWAGGMFRFRAGVKRAAVATLDESWLSQNVDEQGNSSKDAVISGFNGIPRDRRINRVTGRCIDSTQRYQMLPFPAVQDTVLIAAKGVRAEELELEGVAHIAQAQHLASIAIRRAQAGSRWQTQCGLRALKLDLLDVAAFQLPDYGFNGNEAEVTGWRWSPNGTINVQWEEIAAGIYTLDPELKGRDLAPDSGLRKPWEVEQITGLNVTSGTTPTLDGSILTRTTVTWAAAVGENIRRGGDIEIQYIEVFGANIGGDWPSWTEQGSSIKAILPSLLSERTYIFRARAVQRLPLVRGPWSNSVSHRVATLPQLPGASNMLWGAQNGPAQAGPGVYGVAVATLKTSSSNPYGLKPGETLTLSADVWQDAASAGANQQSWLYLYTSGANNVWTRSAIVSTAALAAARSSSTLTLPSSADMVNVEVGLYHQLGTSNTIGTVFADRMQVERGVAATFYAPGSQPGATIGAPNGTLVGDVPAEDVEIVETFRASFTNVLVTGESGTGPNTYSALKWTPCGSITFTPTRSGDATLAVNLEATVSGTSAINPNGIFCKLWLNVDFNNDFSVGAGDQIFTTYYTEPNTATPPTLSRFDGFKSKPIQVVAGQTYTWPFYAQCEEPGPVSTTFNLIDVLVSVRRA